MNFKQLGLSNELIDILKKNGITTPTPRGKKVALVGESGSGKTTVSKLLLRYFVPEEGKINLSGYDISEIDLYNLRKNICYVPQNVELFSGSIRENITMGNRNISNEDVKMACENSGCKEFIERLPVKYETFLEEAGGGLSGGEKQRIALARALVKKPNFLILDEATSNLDFISEARIFDTLFKKGKDITMLMIAHRLSTIRNCDVIYVMDKGQVVECGNHESLLKKKGYYYKLYISQVGVWKLNLIYEKKKSRNHYFSRITDYHCDMDRVYGYRSQTYFGKSTGGTYRRTGHAASGETVCGRKINESDSSGTVFGRTTASTGSPDV